MKAPIKGAFSLKRPGNAFAGAPVEQSNNAHATNCVKGNMGYANINFAVNRWHVTNAMRSKIPNALLE